MKRREAWAASGCEFEKRRALEQGATGSPSWPHSKCCFTSPQSQASAPNGPPPLVLCHYFLCAYDVRSFGLACKEMHEICASDTLWRGLCETRWRSKWGFARRWRAALHEAESVQDCTGARVSWRERYKRQELDAKRSSITVDELQSFHFDARRRAEVEHSLTTALRFVEPRCLRDDLPEPGLGRSSAYAGDFGSRPVRDLFALTLGAFPVRVEDQSHIEWNFGGHVQNFPVELEDPRHGFLRTDQRVRQGRIKWCLSADGQSLQWGLLPCECCPVALVRRLKSWGWEIMSDKVVLRSVEPPQGEESPLNASVPNEGLWSDLLQELETWRVWGSVRRIPGSWMTPRSFHRSFATPLTLTTVQAQE